MAEVKCPVHLQKYIRKVRIETLIIDCLVEMGASTLQILILTGEQTISVEKGGENGGLGTCPKGKLLRQGPLHSRKTSFVNQL